jgi:O-antigen/teichoic acid export membrane protein
VLIAVAGAATTVLVARLLGPSGSGSYFVAQSMILVLTVMTTIGIEHGITYLVSSRRWAAGDAYRVAAKAAWILGILGAVLGIGLRLLVPSAFAALTVPLIVTAACALPFAVLLLFASSVALAIDRYEAYALFPSLQAVLSFAMVGVGAALFGLSGAVVGLALAIALVGAGSAMWALKLPRDHAPNGLRQLRRAMTFGVSGYAGNALQILNYRLDLFVLAAVASRATVGRYSVAVAATSVLWLLPSALADVLLPRVARLTSSQDEAHREMAEVKSLRHVTLIVPATAIGLGVAMELLVVPVYGGDFKPAIDLGLILLPGAALVPSARVLAATLAGRGKPIYPLYSALISTPVTVGLYATLIPGLHATGAALASTLSYATSFVVLSWFYRRVTARPLLFSFIPTRSEIADIWALRRAVLGGWKMGGL